MTLCVFDSTSRRSNSGKRMLPHEPHRCNSYYALHMIQPDRPVGLIFCCLHNVMRIWSTEQQQKSVSMRCCYTKANAYTFCRQIWSSRSSLVVGTCVSSCVLRVTPPTSARSVSELPFKCLSLQQPINSPSNVANAHSQSAEDSVDKRYASEQGNPRIWLAASFKSDRLYNIALLPPLRAKTEHDFCFGEVWLVQLWLLWPHFCALLYVLSIQQSSKI